MGRNDDGGERAHGGWFTTSNYVEAHGTGKSHVTIIRGKKVDSHKRARRKTSEDGEQGGEGVKAYQLVGVGGGLIPRSGI